ncbi:Uncharacterised protein [uncultured archaeon]|nr:Uncharacterised protein [uncultured archaeon]
MLIWTAMLIPVLTVLVLAFFFNKKMAWWEYLVVLGIPALIILGIKADVEASQVHCTEYWGAYLTKGAYYEEWNEYIHQTCTRSYPCGTDSEGHIEWCTETYDCSYVATHPEYWEVTNSIGEDFSVSKQYFENLCKLWGSRVFVDMNRHYYTEDGDAYVTTFDKDYEHTIPTTTKHSYENRVQASHSVFNFREFKKGEAQQLGLFDHPPINSFDQTSVLGTLSSHQDKKYVDFTNAYLGAPSKFRMYILSWQGKGQDIAVQQEAYWKGGNKNEIVICVGMDSANTKAEWCKVFGWSKNEILKINIRDCVVGQNTLDLKVLAGYVNEQVKGKVIRRDFREFSYLTVDPPTSAVVWTFIVTALLCGGLAWFSVVNEFDRDCPSGSRY